MAVIGEWSFPTLILTHLSLSFLCPVQLRSFERPQRCFETFWDAHVWGRGIWGCALVYLPSPEPAGLQQLPVSGTPEAILHTPPLELQSRPWVAKWTEILPEWRAQESQWLFKAKQKAIRCLQPISSWNFYLHAAGIQELVALNALFHIFSVFLFFSFFFEFSLGIFNLNLNGLIVC